MTSNTRPKLMEKLFTADMMFETYDVEVDLWENQRYKPLGGWTAPYLGTFPPYSNLSGDKPVDFERVDQLPCLPDGWSWVESQWEVDVPENRRADTKSYPVRGETDTDGWSYAGSMETLVKAAQDRLLMSERSTMNTARRRRWRRTRRCMQMTSKKIEAYRREYVKKTCRSMDGAIDQSTKLATTMQDFHYKWRRSVDNVLRINDKLNKETSSQLAFLRSKLVLLKECLTDIGQIEARYAERLRQFSSKWMNAGQRDFARQSNQQKEEEGAASSITRRISISLMGGLSASHQQTDVEDEDESSNASAAVEVAGKANATGDEDSEDKGFFRAVARANEEIADHKSVFASSLNSLLPADIDRILSDLEDLIDDHQSETTHTRTQLLTLREVAEETLSACVSAAFAATRRLSIERSVLMDSLMVVPATWDSRVELVPPILNEELVDVHNIFPSLDSLTNSDSNAGSGGAGSTGSGGQYAAVSGSAAQDTWFLLLRYGQTLVQANASMLLLHAQSKVYQRKMNQQCVVVSDLLMSLVKLFAHEHFRCYSEAQTILLDAIGAIASKQQTSMTTEIDAEQDLQLLHSQQLAAATVAATGAGTLKVSDSHIDAIRQKHLQALPTTNAAHGETTMSHQGLNEEELAAHLATAITPAPVGAGERRVLGAPVKRSASSNTVANSNAADAGTGKSVQMPPLATILPFISLYRSKIITVAEVRFLCLAPGTNTNNGPASGATSLTANSIAANVPQWRWQRGALVLTQDLCMHLVDLGLPSKPASATASADEEETEVTIDEFYAAVESGLDNFRVFFTCSVARATVLPLLLTTNTRFANTFQVRLHPAYHAMTVNAAAAANAASSLGNDEHHHHHHSGPTGAMSSGSATRAMEAAASSFFSSMFSSSTLSSLSSSNAAGASSSTATANHHVSSAASASSTTMDASTQINLSTIINVFAGSTAAASAALASSTSSMVASSYPAAVTSQIHALDNIHAAGRYTSVHCDPRPANMYHASIAHTANICSVLIAPLSAASTATLLKKLATPFCEMTAKTPEAFANDVLANPSMASASSDVKSETPAVAPLLSASTSTSSLASSSNDETFSFSASSLLQDKGSNSGSAAAMSSSSSSAPVASSNGISTGNGPSVAMMANPMMKNPLLKRTTSAVMKRPAATPAPAAPSSSADSESAASSSAASDSGDN